MITIKYTSKTNPNDTFPNIYVSNQSKEDHEFLNPFLINDYNQEDITAEVLKKEEENRDVEKYLKRINFGQRLMAELSSMNKKKIDAGAFTREQVIVLKKTLAPIKDFITEGSLGFAHDAIAASDSLPEDLKSYFTKKISDYLQSEVI